MRRKVDPEDAGKLAPDLEQALKAVGPERYAKETARDFAKGGKYNPLTKRQRYAIT